MPARKPRRRAPERGYKLAQAARMRHLTAAARRAHGVAKSTIGRIETGVLQPSVSIALRLARALDSSVELLFAEVVSNATSGYRPDRRTSRKDGALQIDSVPRLRNAPHSSSRGRLARGGREGA